MKTLRPSIFRIIQTDYVAYASVGFTVLCWVSLLLLGGSNSDLFYLGKWVTLLAIPILLWRINFYLKLFEKGVEITAEVRKIVDDAWSDPPSRVDFSYSFEGAQYTSSGPIMRPGRTDSLSTGQQITILVDPKHPKRAIIKQLCL